ncbi:tail completion protein gp17 [Fructobacillus fructosus]|uniref:tail completion protein gp17 n=1 Tax=Fructobacillus fructosus TaxID=1631 RepID=UPI004034281F
MSNPYNEIFQTVIELSKKQGYDTFDYLPDESQSYPFVFVGNQQNTDIPTKGRTLGTTHIQIDVYAEFNRRSEVLDIMDALQATVINYQHTDNFTYQVTNTNQQMIADQSTDIPLWHGVLELDIQYL